MLKIVMSKLECSENYIRNVCQILRNLCKSAKSKDFNNFAGISNELISLLISKCMNSESSLQSINDAMLVIMDLIETAKNVQLCVFYINFAIENFCKLSGLGGEKKELTEAGFFTIIQTCLIGLKNQGRMDTQMMERIYNLTAEYFKKINDVN